jgi:Protein of unknown function (DUF2911)
MLIRKMLSILGLALAIAIVLPVLRADEANQATKVTFSQPVQIPGKILPAGSYWIQLARTGDPGIVQIVSDQHEVIATLLTISRERQEPTDHSEFVLANQGNGKTETIVAWFYPNRMEGHEFLYSKAERQELARGTKENVIAGD